MDHSTLALQIGHCCTEALIMEVSATPKPGLVDRGNSGAHSDMDFNTFMNSIDAIGPFFSTFARLGTCWAVPDGNSLPRIRPMGMACEKAMFAATQGVNTHKGAIFSLGIIAAAAGYCGTALHDLRAETVCKAASIIANPAQRDFRFSPKDEPMTKGRELYMKYGIRGIRGEVADGFPSVRRKALPELRHLAEMGLYTPNHIHLQVLLLLMEQVDDTNVIARCGLPAVNLLHTEARRILAQGGALSPRGITLLQELDRSFIEQNISPGGCADLLSVTIALYEIEQLEKKSEGNRHV